MNLAYKKILGKFTKVLGFGKTPPHVGKDSQIISFFSFDSVPYKNNYGRNGHILQYKMFGEYCHWTFCTVFKDKLIFVRYMKQSLTLVFGTVFIGWNQLQIFDNDNFSIIPKSIFSDNDNLPISSKNADLSAVDNFFDNIAHP